MRVAITLLIFLFSLVTFGQARTSSDNRFLVHLDKPFYITGDKIWYKLYYPEEYDQVAIKVLLVDEKDQVIQDYFHITSKDKSLSGYMPIPYNYTTGQYRLLFNALIKTQKIIVDEATQVGSFVDVEQEINLSEISFPVFNDLAPGLDSTMVSNHGTKPNKNLFKNELDINVSINNQSITTRDKINLDIAINSSQNSNPGISELSISIIPKKVRLTEENGLSYIALGPDHKGNLNNLLSKDIYLKGTVTGANDKKLQLNVIGAYTNKLNKILYTKSDKEGEFTLKFPKFYGAQTVQFLPYEQEVDKFTIKLDKEYIPETEVIPFVFNETIESFLEENRKRKKLLQYYEYLENNAEVSRMVNQEFTNKPDARYIVAEYEKFEKVYDFFGELITPLQFKIVKKETIASLSNPKATHAFATNLMGNPLFLINGLATRDAGYAANLSMSNIETIELFNSPDELRKQFNILGLSGVVKIKTITPLFDIPEEDKEDLFTVNGLQQQGKFVGYTPKSNSSNLPYFYSTIYWNPDLKTDENGKLKTSFFQTDDHGEFSIIIVAQNESGKLGIKVLDYIVE